MSGFRDNDIFRCVFERVVEACISAGLVAGKEFAVDASLIVADANRRRSIRGAQWSTAIDPQTASRATKEYLATLDDAAFGAASEVRPKFVSPSDPAAQWTGAMRGPAFFGYADNYLIDVKVGIIMDVEATRAIRQAEVGAARTMIERTEQRFAIKPERLAGDTAYGSGANLDWLVNEAKITPHIPVNDKSKREDGTFSREDFSFDKERNVYICPAGKVLTTTGKLASDGRLSTTGPGHAIAAAAPSNRSAVRRRRCAESRAASTSRPAMLPGQRQRPKHSSSLAVIESASRCCSPISSAFSGSAGCAYGGQGAPSSSSRWQLSLRTSGGSPSFWCDRRRLHNSAFA